MLSVLVRVEAEPFGKLIALQVSSDVDIQLFEQCTCSSYQSRILLLAVVTFSLLYPIGLWILRAGYLWAFLAVRSPNV